MTYGTILRTKLMTAICISETITYSTTNYDETWLAKILQIAQCT